MEIKNYYSILGIADGEPDPEAIRSAYKTLCNDLHPNHHIGDDCRSRNTDINEAFLVLSDENLKQEYDAFRQSLVTEDEGAAQAIPSDTLSAAIAEKRAKAEEFVTNFFAEYDNRLKKSKKNKKWGVIIAGALLLIPFIIGVISACPRSAKHVDILGSFDAPKDWISCNFSDIFTISVPSYMEFSKNTLNDMKPLSEFKDLDIQPEEIILLRTTNTSISDEHAVISAHYAVDNTDDYLRHNETEEINSFSRHEMDDIIKQTMAPQSVIGTLTYRWIDINGTKALEVSFNVFEGSFIDCKMYMFNNYHELAYIIFYMPPSSSSYSADFENVIRTFKWTNPQ